MLNAGFLLRLLNAYTRALRNKVCSARALIQKKIRSYHSNSTNAKCVTELG